MYANLLKKPEGWIAPSAVAPLSQLADGLPGNASAATSAEGPGKGSMGGKGAASEKKLKQALTKRGIRGSDRKSCADAGDDGA